MIRNIRNWSLLSASALALTACAGKVPPPSIRYDDAMKPATMCSKVDLPQPDGPSRETNSPDRTSRSMPCNACVG